MKSNIRNTITNKQNYISGNSGNGKSFPKKSPAFVLIIVLIVVAVLVTTTATLAWDVSTNAMTTGSRIARQQNQYTIEAVINLIIRNLRRKPLQKELLNNGFHTGRLKLGEAVVYYRIADESAKYKLTSRDTDNIPPFIENLEPLPPAAETGTEKRDSRRLYEDVLKIEMDELHKFYHSPVKDNLMGDLITLWTDGRVNVNTSPRTVIKQALDSLSRITLERLLQLRKNRYIENINCVSKMLTKDARERNIICARLTTSISCVSVRITCVAPSLRTDNFLLLSLDENTTTIRIFKDLPPIGEIPSDSQDRQTSKSFFKQSQYTKPGISNTNHKDFIKANI